MSTTWIDDRHLKVGDVLFTLDADPEAFAATQPTADEFPLVKRRSMVDDLVERIPAHEVDTIFELGIFKGGSTAFYRELYQPRRLVAIELSHHRVPGLDAYVEDHSLQDVVRLFYGTKQGDRARLVSIVEDQFGREPLDLVVDDCSHRYEPTKTSFEVLFPRLRPGGWYVIEDWGWAHWPSPSWQRPARHWADEPTPLSTLIFELVMVAASRPGLVAKIEIDGSSAVVVRGDEPVTDPRFDVSTAYLTGGRTLLAKRSHRLRPRWGGPGGRRPRRGRTN